MQEKLDIWKNRLPTEIDFDTDTKFILFKALHFVMILHGLELFDIKKIKEEYDTLDDGIKDDADKIRQHLLQESNQDHRFLSHKEFLNLIRESV